MQTALITGVGRGIGKALAQKFLAEGWRVIGTAQTGAVDYEHENLTILQLDLAKQESVDACVAEVEKLGMKLDVLINNAGVLLDEEHMDLVPELLRQTLEINLIGTATLTERLLPLMAAKSHLIIISSTAGSLEYTVHGASHYPGHYPAYKISKAALNMYARTLAGRLMKEEIIVSAVHPGWVRTEMGGDDADISPEESAEDIYAFAITRPESGFFWSKGERLPW